MAEQSQVLVVAVSGLLGIFAGGTLLVYLGDRIFPPNHPPTAELQVIPESGQAPLPVSFMGAGSSDPNGDELTYHWAVGETELRAREATATHTFTEAGRHVVTLEVRDPEGLTDKAAKSVTIAPAFDLSSFLMVFDRAKRMVESGEVNVAESLFDDLLDQCDLAPPDQCAKAYALKADMEVGRGRFSQAREAIAQAVRRQPDDVDFNVRLASYLLIDADYEDAIEQLLAMRDRYPEARQPQYYLALAHALSQDYQPARQHFEPLASRSRNFQHHGRFGVALVRLLDDPRTDPDQVAQTLRNVACNAGRFTKIRLSPDALTEPDLVCFQRLASRLPDATRVWLHEVLETSQCR